ISEDFASIPGNIPDDHAVKWNEVDRFIGDQNLAMYFTVNRFSSLEDSDVDWDIAQSPYFPDNPNVGGVVDAFIIGVGKHGEHKEDAFRVVESFLSDEVQLQAVKKLGFFSPLSDIVFQE